jgi:cephalosporin hydroxylase
VSNRVKLKPAEATPVDPKMDGVVLAYVCSNEVTYSWHQSVTRLRDLDAQLYRRMHPDNGGGFISIRHGTGGLVAGRNQAVHEFLTEFPDAQWLFWLDTDMGFPADTLELLLGAADPVERPIVGALCFSLRELDPDGAGGWRTQPVPTIYDWIHVPTGEDEASGYAVRWDYPPDTATRCHATGSACVVIHRSALEAIEAKFGTWYDRVPNPSSSQFLGEDLSFCVRAGALDIPIYVDTRVKTTHSKRVWISEDDYVQFRAVHALVDQPAGSSLPVHVDIAASLESLAQNKHVREDGMLKLDEDLERYRQIIEATKPEIIVETGTRSGASARWFLDECRDHPNAPSGVGVITVDVSHDQFIGAFRGDDEAYMVKGDASDPDIAAKVAKLVGGRRCMVSLDSDHSGPHVSREIELYGPLVSPGCYLVVEDGIFGYATRTLRTGHGLGDMVGSPLDAIEKLLDGSDEWSRDIAIERQSPITHHPAGFWVRRD